MIKSNELNETLYKVLQKNREQELDYKCTPAQSCIVLLVTRKRITQFPNNNFCNILKPGSEELISGNRVINLGLHPKT